MDENQEIQPTAKTDNVRQSPTSSDYVRPRPTLSGERRDEHTLTSREVLKLFEQSGLPRSQRSIERYCQDKKLDCFFESDEQRYYMTQASIERLIGQLKEIQARHTQSAVDEPSPTTTDNVRQSPPPPDEQQEKARAGKTKELEETLSHLEKELIDEKILNKAKDYFIDQLKEDRQHFVDERKTFIVQLTESSRMIGELETKLLQLEAPKQQPAGATTTPRHKPEAREAEFDENHDWQSGEPARIYVAAEPEPAQTKQI